VTVWTERVVVYALENPMTGVVRYVGRTRRDLRARYRQHLNRAAKGEGSVAVDAWISKLAAYGLRPALRVLEEVTDGDDGAEEEGYWIERYQDTILNSTAEHLNLAERWREGYEWHRIYGQLSAAARAMTVELDRIEQGSRVAWQMLLQATGLQSVERYGWAVTLRRFSEPVITHPAAPPTDT
jgi:hypothetical protein